MNIFEYGILVEIAGLLWLSFGWLIDFFNLIIHHHVALSCICLSPL